MFAIASPFFGCLSETADKRFIIGFGFVGLTGSLFLSSGVDKNLPLTFVGLALNGVFIAAVFAPVIPEVIQTMSKEFEENQNQNADKRKSLADQWKENDQE